MKQQPMKDSEHISAFLKFIRGACVQVRLSADEVKQADIKSQDIMHRLELFSDDYSTTARLGKLMRQVRRDRRAAKEAIECLEPIANWATENKATLSKLEYLLGVVRDTENLQRRRSWRPKTDVLKDIEAKEADKS